MMMSLRNGDTSNDRGACRPVTFTYEQNILVVRQSFEESHHSSTWELGTRCVNNVESLKGSSIDIFIRKGSAQDGYLICWPKKRRNGGWHTQRNCSECLGLTEPNDCSTWWPGTRLGYTAMAFQTSGAIRWRWIKMNPDRCFVQDFGAENDFLKLFLFSTSDLVAVDSLPEKTTLTATSAPKPCTSHPDWAAPTGWNQ